MLAAAVHLPLDPAATAPFTLGPANGAARGGVLLLHGFTGSPWEVRPLGESLADRGFRVRAPRLPGHGTVPEALLWVTWREWVDAAERELLAFPPGQRVAVAGLSMGALLGLILAARHPDRVAGLALLAPAWQLSRWDGRLLRALRHFELPALRGRWLTKDTMDLEDPEARAQAPVLPRYPMARLFDLFTLQDVARESVPLVRVPALLLGAAHDHVVASEGLEELHRLLPGSRSLTVQRGFHILPRDRDRALVCAEVAEFVDALELTRARARVVDVLRRA